MTTHKQQLMNLIDSLVADIMAMSDDEILAESDPGNADRVREIINNALAEYRYAIGQHVEKTGGSYSAAGVIKARFLARDGSPRYVIEFFVPAGLLHIFAEQQLREAEDSL